MKRASVSGVVLIGAYLISGLAIVSPTHAVSTLFPTDLPANKWVEFRAQGFSQPVSGVIYRPTDLKPCCGVPLGGIGTGCLDIGADGRLGFCTIFKRVWAHSDVDLEFPYIRNRVYTPSGVVDLPATGRGPLNAPFLGLSVGGRTWVLTTEPIPGVEAARQIHYWGHYPVADMEFDADAPVSVGLRAWAPFLPGDIEDSLIPAAIFEVHLRDQRVGSEFGIRNSEFGPPPADRSLGEGPSQPLKGTIVFSFPGPVEGTGGGDRFSRYPAGGRFSGIVVQAPKASYALGVIGQESLRLGGSLGADGKAWARIADGLPKAAEDDPGASAAVDFAVGPGEEKIIRFLLTWRTPEWESDFPYGVVLNRYTNMYAERFPSALAAARKTAQEHGSLLRRVLAWQEAVYTDRGLPVWLRDQLINILHLITEDAFWVAAGPPLGAWCYQGGLFSLVESTVADGQQSCIPCDWFGNLPLVYFFPDLAWSTLRAYRVNMRADGAVPFTLGRGLDLAGERNGEGFQYERQRTLNGFCYADIADRLWLRTGNAQVLREFYPSIKQSAIYTMNLYPGPDGIISAAGDHWYEGMAWPGMTSHVGGVRLAHLRIVERMAEKMGDEDFGRRCREWFAQGSNSLENKLWDREAYLIYSDPKTGQKSDLVLAFQLDGEQIAHFHGLPGVFRPDRVRTTLDTIQRLNVPVTRGGAVDVIQRDGRPTGHGGRMGGMTSMPASVFILAQTYLYAGLRDAGLEIGYKCMNNLVNELGFTWDLPNMVRADPGHNDRVYGTDYYQCWSFWGFPAVLQGRDLTGPCQPGGLVDRMIRGASGDPAKLGAGSGVRG